MSFTRTLEEFDQNSKTTVLAQAVLVGFQRDSSIRSVVIKQQARLNRQQLILAWKPEVIMGSFDVILHPTDFSEDSDQAFQLACNMARDQFATLVVVHVLSPSCSHLCQAEEDLNEDHGPIVEECRKQFNRMKALAPDIPVSFRLVFGHAVGAILQVAAEVNAELIVIASHRHDQFHLQLHGSVAEGVLRQTPCPVVVLRQPTTSLKRTLTASVVSKHS